jgi:hypothetical protein
LTNIRYDSIIKPEERIQTFADLWNWGSDRAPGFSGTFDYVEGNILVVEASKFELIEQSIQDKSCNNFSLVLILCLLAIVVAVAVMVIVGQTVTKDKSFSGNINQDEPMHFVNVKFSEGILQFFEKFDIKESDFRKNCASDAGHLGTLFEELNKLYHPDRKSNPDEKKEGDELLKFLGTVLNDLEKVCAQVYTNEEIISKRKQ